jgi:mono/diheme cytochrome c family protein
LNKAYLPPEFDDEVFDHLWYAWEEPLRRRAETATAAERRRLAYSRYGFTPRPGKDDKRRPLQYTASGADGWSANCLACHGGKVAGKAMPGLPNSHFAMQTLFDDVATVKLFMGKIGKREVLGSFFPLGGSNGTTNAVMFGVAVTSVRDRDLNFDDTRPIPKFLHHDMDPPPWWHLKKKKWLYADGTIENDHRALMTFLLSSKGNTGKIVRDWEDDFRAMYDWMLTIEPPKYPYSIDKTLAAQGQAAFNDHCAQCHGTYGAGGKYPNKIVPHSEVGTDRARLDALSEEHLKWYEASWLSDYGRKKVNASVRGYVAPPLDGIWASAPYFHNGSAPTLWHVLHPDERPIVWQRTEDGYDQKRVGLEVMTYDRLPDSAHLPAERRQYFNTREFGKSAAGHRFPDALGEDERWAVLEYLKML